MHISTMEESLLRIADRFGKRFEELFAVLPYCNKATFYDNDNGFVTVAKYKNGELQTIGQNSPNGF